MALNIESIQELIKKGSFFTTDTPLIEYLVEHNLNNLEEYGMLITEGEVFFFCTEAADIRDVIPIAFGKGTSEHILSKLGNVPIPQPIHMDLFLEQAVYLKYFQSCGKQVVDISEKIGQLKQIKTEQQIKNIRHCVSLNQKAYKDFRYKFHLGMNELECKGIIEQNYYEETKREIPYVKDIISGVRTSQVSGITTDYVPKQGDTVILDLLPRNCGIYCDTTRTFFLGEPSKKQRDTYTILLTAMEEAKSILKPGTKGWEIHKKMSHCFGQYGVEEKFPHHAGHSFGHTTYEAPYFILGDFTELKSGMTVALEPGLYFTKEFGIRIENNYLITEDGFEELGAIPLGLEHFIL